MFSPFVREEREDSSMNAEELRKLLNEIDEMMARVETTTDAALRIKLLEEALFKACRYTKGLNRQIGTVIKRVLEWGRFDESRAALPLRDIARTDYQLEVFRDKEILIEFLEAGRDLLRNQMQLSDDEIDQLISHIQNSYDLFMDEKMSAEPLLENFKRLERFFCRPPWGGPGGPLVGPNPPDDGPGGVTADRAAKVQSYIDTLSSVGSFLISVFEKIFSGSAQQMDESEASNAPYAYQVLALLLVAGFSRNLDANQEIPAQRVLPRVPAYA